MAAWSTTPTTTFTRVSQVTERFTPNQIHVPEPNGEIWAVRSAGYTLITEIELGALQVGGTIPNSGTLKKLRHWLREQENGFSNES